MRFVYIDFSVPRCVFSCVKGTFWMVSSCRTLPAQCLSQNVPMPAPLPHDSDALWSGSQLCRGGVCSCLLAWLPVGGGWSHEDDAKCGVGKILTLFQYSVLSVYKAFPLQVLLLYIPFLFSLLRLCVHVCTHTCLHVCTHTSVKTRGWHCLFLPLSTLFFEAGSHSPLQLDRMVSEPQGSSLPPLHRNYKHAMTACLFGLCFFLEIVILCSQG